jgi:hypothetical protein
MCRPRTTSFPFRLYQGPLTNGADALVISPSIGEFDGDNVNDYYMLWSQHQNELNGTLYYEPQVHAMIEGKTFGSFNLAGGMSFPQIPIGTNRDIAVGNFSQGTYSFSSSVADTVVVLTREIIEKELARPGPQTDGAAPNGATSVWNAGSHDHRLWRRTTVLLDEYPGGAAMNRTVCFEKVGIPE